MSPQLDPVAELESLKTHVDHPPSPTFRHQSGEASKKSPNGSPRKENEIQGEHSHHKKSLFSKMKDKAKKLQHSLSNKKRHDDECDATLPSFVRSEDHEVVRQPGVYATFSPPGKSKDCKLREEGEEEDPEYLGAPMYESKKAPEELKQIAMKHPRENPVITDTNVLSVLPAKLGQKDCTDSHRENPEKNVLSNVKPSDSSTTTLTESIEENTRKEYKNQEPISPSKTVTETLTDKLAPAYAKVSDATQAITKKIQDMAFPDTETDVNDVSEINTNQPTGFNTKVWDKGVSMKEYISQKFEPSEDDKALSQVISKAISPRKASSSQAAMVPTPNEIVEEENHGKILQPN